MFSKIPNQTSRYVSVVHASQRYYQKGLSTLVLMFNHVEQGILGRLPEAFFYILFGRHARAILI